MRKLSYDEVYKTFSNRGYVLLDTEYKDSKTKMAYMCNKHPEEIQYIHYNSLSNGRGCKYCGLESTSEKKRLSYDIVKQEFEKKGYVLLEENYKNNKQMLRYLCPEHPDKENYIAYSDLQQGHGCSYCVGLKKFTFEEAKHEFESNNFTILDDEYINSSTPVKCYCNFHQEYIQFKTLQQFRHGYGCIYCMGKKATYNTSFGFNYPELLTEWNFNKNKLTPYNILPKSNKKVWWKCSECGNEWQTEVANRTNKQSGCPACSESKGEKRTRKFLIKNKIEFTSQIEFDELIGIRGGSLSYDFYIPKHNLLIEYQGEQHEKFIKGIHEEIKNFKRQQEHDRRKREYAKQNAINLLEIWYWDFDNIEKILENKLLI